MVVLVLVVLSGVDAWANSGTIHRGVKVNGIAVGGLTVEEATSKIDTEMAEHVSAASLSLTPDADSAVRWLDKVKPSALKNDSSYDDDLIATLTELQERLHAGEDIKGQIGQVQTVYWDIDNSNMSASYDSGEMAKQAYHVTREVNVFKALYERLHSYLGGHDITCDLEFDEAMANNLISSVNNTIGVKMQNNDISIDASGSVSTIDGREGWELDQPSFYKALQRTFTHGEQNTTSTVMNNVPVQIDAEQASQVASTVEQAIGSPFTLIYQDKTWTADSGSMGAWISTRVDDEGRKAKLIPYVNPDRAVPSIEKLMGPVGYGNAVDARFDVSSGTPVIIPSQDGTGPNLEEGCTEIQEDLFGKKKDRQITYVESTRQPELTTEKAQEMGINELISEYSIAYITDSSTPDRTYNVERAIDLLDYTFAKPQSDWSWNEEVGECDETTGFKDAGAYLNGEATQEPGGGICNVAVAVYNAAYEGGFPIVKRVGHSMYTSLYPIGRDCTVSWPSPDFVFKNDTDSWILVTATKDGSSMNVRIWGTSPHRTVLSENSDVEKTDKGYQITNYRKVYDSAGKLIREDAFYTQSSTPIPDSD